MQPTGQSYSSDSLGSSTADRDRLQSQSALYNLATQRMLQRAGVGAGMRVLDVGSGNGDVAFGAAELVGPSGEVVGIDISPQLVSLANAKAAEKHLVNVKFVQADVTQWPFESAFDAVVGRLFLMHLNPPAPALAQICRHIKSGGIVAFHEIDYSGVRFSDPLPLANQCLQWVSSTLRKVGADPEIGLKLRKIFVEAGLESPALSIDAVIGGGRDFPGYKLTVETLASLLPVMERLKIASPEEVNLPTLETRLNEELSRVNGVVVLPALVGAWSRKV